MNDIILMAVKKLDALGYIKNSADNWALNHAYERSYSFIKAETNLDKIPDELANLFADLTAAEFLSYKFSSFEAEKPIKQISEGDINIVYSENGAMDTKSYLLAVKSRIKTDLSAYRRLKW